MKRILLLFIFLFSSINAFPSNDVKSCFKGACFGQNMYSVKKELSKSGIDIYKSEENYIILRNINFDGFTFEKVKYLFCNDKFYCIELYSYDNERTRSLHEMISFKYQCHRFGEHISSYNDDNNREIVSEFIPVDGFDYLLFYMDNNYKCELFNEL